jgi:hypothetical protein
MRGLWRFRAAPFRISPSMERPRAATACLPWPYRMSASGHVAYQPIAVFCRTQPSPQPRVHDSPRLGRFIVSRKLRGRTFMELP